MVKDDPLDLLWDVLLVAFVLLLVWIKYGG